MNNKSLIPKDSIIDKIFSFFKSLFNKTPKDTEETLKKEILENNTIYKDEPKNYDYIYQKKEFKKDIDLKEYKKEVIEKYKKLINGEIEVEDLDAIELIMINKLSASNKNI